MQKLFQKKVLFGYELYIFLVLLFFTGVVVGTLTGIGAFCIGCVLAVIVIKAKVNRVRILSV